MIIYDNKQETPYETFAASLMKLVVQHFCGLHLCVESLQQRKFSDTENGTNFHFLYLLLFLLSFLSIFQTFLFSLPFLSLPFYYSSLAVFIHSIPFLLFLTGLIIIFIYPHIRKFFSSFSSSPAFSQFVHKVQKHIQENVTTFLTDKLIYNRTT